MKRFTILLTFLSATVLVWSQQSFFYGPDKLGSTLITAIAQDADGQLWVGTEQGLYTFDGYRFTARKLAAMTDGRPSSNVTALFLDKEKRLWVGTAESLQLLDTKTDRFLRLDFPNNIEPRVTTLLQRRNGQLLAGTAGYGLFNIMPDSLKTTLAEGLAPDDDNSYFTCMLEAGDGSFWKGGINLDVWCRQRDGSTRSQKLETGHATALFERYGKVEVLGQPYTCAATDSEGNVFIGSRGSGLFWIPKRETTMRRYETIVPGLNLDRTRISCLFIDSWGNLWVGCRQRGLLMLPLQRHPLFQTWSFAAQRMETGTGVSAIAEGDDGIIWTAVQGDGIYGFDWTGRIVSHPTAPAGVETIFRDTEGNFFLGTADGLYHYQPKTGQSQLLVRSEGHPINTMAELTRDNLAISVFGSGFWIVNKNNGTVIERRTMYDTDPTGRGQLANDWIHAMDVDKHGRLWLGTSSGICCYDVASGSFDSEGWNVLHDLEACTALRTLHNGRVLFSNNLPSEASTCFITEDQHGSIWVSTANGLYYCTAGDTVFKAPLISAEFVQGAGLQTRSGHILLGMADGILRFHPDSVRVRQYIAGTVHLTAFVVGGEVASVQTKSGGRPIMDSPIAQCHQFSLSHADNRLQLSFSLLDYADVASVVFEYRLTDDTHWQQTAQGENTIALNHLAPGKYRLQVRALSGGIYTETEEYILEIRPPWWLSTLAYIAYALLFVLFCLFSAFVYRRHIQHQTDKEKLHFLISAIHDKDTPLSVEDLKKAVNSFVQGRKRQHGIFGNTAAMAARMDTPEVRGNDEALMERIIQSINQHLSDSDYNIEQLCSEAGISRAQLHRKMKELTGISTSDFIRGIRLEQAARLLREQKLNITQVAYSTGFSSAGHFSTVFKKHFGVSPSDYLSQGDES